MSYDTILKYRQNLPVECRIRFADKGLYLGRSRRSLDPTVWLVTQTGLPISSGSFRNRCTHPDSIPHYPDHHQNSCGCREPTSVTCANQRYDDRRDCGAGHHQFSQQAAPPWLIALGEVMTLNWNIPLTACMPLNWSKYSPFWYRTGNAESTNPQD